MSNTHAQHAREGSASDALCMGRVCMARVHGACAGLSCAYSQVGSGLGYKWNDDPLFASDYFDQMHDYALMLIQSGKAYVCDQSPDEIRKFRGTLTNPGEDSPYRNRSMNENLELFANEKLNKCAQKFASKFVA